MPITPPFHPIIYVRGFAASMAEIEEASASPFMGFNDGATKIRQDHRGRIVRFIFESPLLRLMKDEGYIDTFKDGDELPIGTRCDPRCIWIFRYYEQASRDLGTGSRQTIPDIAQDLRRLILRVRDHVCGDDARDRRAFRVHLVAHSMGGLICRCYLQSLCVHGTGSAGLDEELELAAGRPARPGRSARSAAASPPAADDVHLVDKVFTYGTPHNGIDILGFNVPDLGALDAFHIRNFNRAEIREYLRLPARRDTDGKVNTLNGAFPPERFFTMIGTNYDDYRAFSGLSRKATGPMSDGLVMIENASVEGAPRAFAHRSHSGHYGIVNSEEGYQNLRRFLFGDMRVHGLLFADEITLPRPVEHKWKFEDDGAPRRKRRELRASYHIDATTQVRGGKYLLHERRFDHSSAILSEYDELIHQHKPVQLLTTYLLKSARMRDDAEAEAVNAAAAAAAASRGGAAATAAAAAVLAERTSSELAFALRVGIRVPMYEIDGVFWFNHHFEGGPVFDELITFHIEPDEEDVPMRYGLASQRGVGEADMPIEMRDFDDGTRGIEIDLGFAKGEPNPPRPGFRGRLRLVISPWNPS